MSDDESKVASEYKSSGVQDLLELQLVGRNDDSCLLKTVEWIDVDRGV